MTGQWKKVIAAYVVVIPTTVVLDLVLVMTTDVSNTVAFGIFAIVNYIAAALWLGSPLAFRWDQDVVESRIGWTPWDGYYLMFLPIAGVLIAMAYLFQRRRKHLSYQEVPDYFEAES